MSSPKHGDWCAHVTYADGHIKEVFVESESSNRHVALNKVLKKLNLTGVSDPSIKGINIKEISIPNSKSHKYGDPKPVTDVPKTAPVTPPVAGKFDHEYEVRLFVSPHVSSFRKFSISADNPMVALNGARLMAGVKQVSDLGPYCVLERQHRVDTAGLKYTILITRMVKGAQSFPGIGPVNTSGDYRQPPVIEDRPRAGAVATVPAEKKRDTYISEVIDILSKETKTPQKKYTIKQD